MAAERPCYSIDTSALIDWWQDYPPDVFLGLLPLMGDIISARRLRAVRSVCDEIEDSEEEITLAKWCKKQNHFYVDESQDIQKGVREIMNQFQNPKKPRGISGADPFVIAAALLDKERWYVVSSENPANGNAEKNPNIPFVCAQLGIKHIRFVDMLRMENWQLGSNSADMQ